MRILIADHESNVRYGLRVLLEERSEFEVVGEVAEAKELLAQIQVTCPDLVLLGWELQGFWELICCPPCGVTVTTCT